MRLVIDLSEKNKVVLGAEGIESIRQNIRDILLTPKMTVPEYRQFGVEFDFVDKPVLIASPIIVAKIKEAIEEFEKRVRVREITFTIDKNNPGQLLPRVEVEIIEL